MTLLRPFALLGLVALGSSSAAVRTEGEAPEIEKTWIAFSPDAGTVVEKQFLQTSQLTLERMVRQAPGMREERNSGLTIKESSKLIFRDTYKTRYGESPSMIEREFIELGESGVALGVKQDEWTRTSPFEGKTVLFSGDIDSDKSEAAYVGEEADKCLLDGLVQNTDMFAFVPPAQVAVGDEWDVSLGWFVWDVLKPGGCMAWTEPVRSPVADWVADRIREKAEGSIRAQYLRMHRTSKGAFAAIKFSGRIKSSASLEENADALRNVDAWFDIEGELSWDLEHHMLHTLTMERKGRYTLSYEKGEESMECLYGYTADLKITYEL